MRISALRDPPDTPPSPLPPRGLFMGLSFLLAEASLGQGLDVCSQIQSLTNLRDFDTPDEKVWCNSGLNSSQRRADAALCESYYARTALDQRNKTMTLGLCVHNESDMTCR